ncbi:cytochrome c biogenesis protein CcsA [Candidatus Sumerlaeota bacterium]|nr:cytochrome c biogenesis protein CcsA [Candidatus Sumerlaeota bacterium]
MISGTLLHAIEAIVLLGYFCAMGGYILFFAHQEPRQARMASRILGATVAIHMTWWVLKIHRLGYFPFSQWADCVSFIAFALALGYLFIELAARERRMGFCITPLPFLLQALAIHQLWRSNLAVQPPAELHSAWANLHVATALIACAAFALSFCVSVMYLMLSREIRSKILGRFFHRIPPLAVLDEINAKLLALGLALFTVAVAVGIIWEQVESVERIPAAGQALMMAIWACYGVNVLGGMKFGWQGARMSLLSIFNFTLVLVAIILGGFAGKTFHG